MKKMLFFTAAMLISVTLVQAEFVNINDKPIGADGVQEKALFELFNGFFGTSYIDGPELIADADVAVNPYSTWKTRQTTIIGGYQQSDARHRLGLYRVDNGSLIEDPSRPFVGGGVRDLDTLPREGLGNLGDGVVFGNLEDDINLNLTLFSDWGDTTRLKLSSNPTKNQNSNINMLAFDVTDLYNGLYDDDDEFGSVYMFAWEDLLPDSLSYDEDYQDVILIMTNLVRVDPVAPTPEPATLAVLGLGLVGVGLASRRRRK